MQSIAVRGRAVVDAIELVVGAAKLALRLGVEAIFGQPEPVQRDPALAALDDAEIADELRHEGDQALPALAQDVADGVVADLRTGRTAPSPESRSFQAISRTCPSRPVTSKPRKPT